MATRQAQQLCIVSIGYQRFLLPQAQALKFMEVASRALTAEYDLNSAHRVNYRIGEAPEVELTTVRAEQLIMPEAVAVSAARGRRKPLLLNGGGV